MKLGSKMYPEVAYERGEDVYLFSGEAGLPFSLDIDSELELWFSGLGKLRFEFAAKTDVGALCRCISIYTLK